MYSLSFQCSQSSTEVFINFWPSYVYRQVCLGSGPLVQWVACTKTQLLPFVLFRGSSQATTGKLKKEFELRRFKELKDRVQSIAIWILTQGKDLYLRTFIDGVYE